MAVVKEYVSENAIVRIHDDYIDKEGAPERIERVSNIILNAMLREMKEKEDSTKRAV